LNVGLTLLNVGLTLGFYCFVQVLGQAQRCMTACRAEMAEAQIPICSIVGDAFQTGTAISRHSQTLAMQHCNPPRQASSAQLPLIAAPW
jgi:hypothetical protein